MSWLLQPRADVNAQGGEYGDALQAASRDGHEKVVHLLLDAKPTLDDMRSATGEVLYLRCTKLLRGISYYIYR